MTSIQFLIKDSNFGMQIATIDSNFNLTLPEETPNHISNTLKELAVNLRDNNFYLFHTAPGVELLNTKTVSTDWFKQVAEGIGRIYYNKEDSYYIFVKEHYFNELSTTNTIYTDKYGMLRLQPVLDAKEEYLNIEKASAKIPANVVRDMIDQPLDILKIEVYKKRLTILPSELEAKEGQSKLLCYSGDSLAVITMGVEFGKKLNNSISVNIKSYSNAITDKSLLELITDSIMNNYNIKGPVNGFVTTIFD